MLCVRARCQKLECKLMNKIDLPRNIQRLLLNSGQVAVVCKIYIETFTLSNIYIEKRLTIVYFTFYICLLLSVSVPERHKNEKF